MSDGCFGAGMPEYERCASLVDFSRRCRSIAAQHVVRHCARCALIAEYPPRPRTLTGEVADMATGVRVAGEKSDKGPSMAQLSGAAEKLDALKWRCIGPPRGGRVVAVAGDPEDRGVFYFGACAGG